MYYNKNNVLLLMKIHEKIRCFFIFGPNLFAPHPKNRRCQNYCERRALRRFTACVSNGCLSIHVLSVLVCLSTRLTSSFMAQEQFHSKESKLPRTHTISGSVLDPPLLLRMHREDDLPSRKASEIHGMKSSRE